MLFILFMKHVIGANEITQGLFTLLYFLAGIVGMPLWIWLSRRHSKHRIWCVAMVLASTAFATVPALEAGDILPVWDHCAVNRVLPGRRPRTATSHAG